MTQIITDGERIICVICGSVFLSNDVLRYSYAVVNDLRTNRHIIVIVLAPKSPDLGVSSLLTLPVKE